MSGNPNWKPETDKDDIIIFLENYKYNSYDIVLNIADLMASTEGIISPADRIADIDTRRIFDPTNRSYFLAEFSNKMINILTKVKAYIPENLLTELKVTKDVSTEEIYKKFKAVSDLFFENYQSWFPKTNKNVSPNQGAPRTNINDQEHQAETR